MGKPDTKRQKSLEIIQRSVDSLIPYARNARAHSEEQVAQIAGSIKEFGFNDPIAVDGEGVIIEGHGRVMAARKLGMTEVPVIVLAHMSESQKRAYILAHNKIALNSGWDEDMLKAELDALAAESFELAIAGWSQDELSQALSESNGGAGNGQGEGNKGLSDTYTKKIKIPVYEPKGEKPPIKDLFDRDKTARLVAEIKAAGLPKDVTDFLILASERHTSFHFRNIAEFYCHADKKVQDLMEKNGLVIIDFNKAIEYGFVHLTERLGALADIEQQGQEPEDDA